MVNTSAKLNANLNKIYICLNKIDNGLRINRNVSNLSIFHLFLGLIFLIKRIAKPIFSALHANYFFTFTSTHNN